MRAFSHFTTPQLAHLHSGKVRESFRLDEGHRLIVVSDRISCFDQVLKTPIPDKGAVLNGIAAYWFDATRSICPNHFQKMVDPSVSVVREAHPIKVEVVVRGFLTGSAWRKYETGKRTFSGVTVPDGLSKNHRFPAPILTPTTKEESDREITPDEMIALKLATKKQWQEMSRVALSLFSFANEALAPRNLILVDTKYEFGLVEGQLVLIDEIHTPDSSRFWYADSYAHDPLSVRSLDKEFVREWLLDQEKSTGIRPDALPEDVIDEARRRYLEIFSVITGRSLASSDQEVDVDHRIYTNLCRSDLIKDGCVALVMGSAADLPHAKKIAAVLEPYEVGVDFRVVSAHKNGEQIVSFAREYNHAVEPLCVIAIAGRSNGLGGALAANLAVPVISCPPFRDHDDLQINLNSSIMMPSKVPAAVVVDPENAALAALRCLNLHRLKQRFFSEIVAMKTSLEQDDRRVRGR